MKFKAFTRRSNNTTVHVSPDHVVAIGGSSDGAAIYTTATGNDGPYVILVNESIDVAVSILSSD